MSHFDWYEFYKVAEELSQKDDEASIRSAISRYYYAAFCSARYYLVEFKREEKFLTHNSAHKKVHEELQRSSNDNESELGDLLETLFEKRNNADYQWENVNKSYFSNELPIVREKVNLAFEHISALKNNPTNFKF